jgi:hypothetical protein
LSSTEKTRTKQPQTDSETRPQQRARLQSELPFQRGETPLFLPEATPFPGEGEISSVTPVPLTTDNGVETSIQNEVNEEETVTSGMIALTQLLQNSSMYRIDSDSDGEEAGVFMGDPEASRDIF